MAKGIFCISVMMLLCSSCVSRSTTTGAGFNTADRSGKVTSTKTVWFWQKEFRNP